MTNRIDMKPLLGALVKEAVRLALDDVCAPGDTYNFDPDALGNAVSCRLLGEGGWTVNGVYSGNASVFDLVAATFPDVTKNPNDDLTAQLDFFGVEGKPISGIDDLDKLDK